MAVLAAVAVLGCAAPAPKEEQKPKQEPLIKHPITVTTAPGEADARDPKTNGRSYHVSWQKATVDFGNEGVFAGAMETVSGSMFDKDRQANSFRADKATADKKTQLLTLIGHVRVTSASQKAVLTCDKAEWHNERRLIKAFGHVKVAGQAGTLGGLDEVWAMPDLNVYGTPDMFKKP